MKGVACVAVCLVPFSLSKRENIEYLIEIKDIGLQLRNRGCLRGNGFTEMGGLRERGSHKTQVEMFGDA